MAVTGNTQLTVTKQDLVAALVQKELISSSVLGATVMDVSRFAVKGARTVAFPKAGSFTVEDRATATQATIQSVTFANDILTLDKMATVSWLIDPQDEIESVLNVDAEYAARAARAHAVYIDQQIILQLEAAGVATTNTGAISDDTILDMRTALRRHKANMRALTLAVSPEDEAAMLAINKFTLVQDYGSAVVQSGVFGFIYGTPVVITPELASGQYFMYDQEGIAIAFQRGAMMDSRKAPEYGAGAELKVLDQKFGVKALEIAQDGVGAGLSALIAKDNN